jgi:hypothetical protein
MLVAFLAADVALAVCFGVAGFFCATALGVAFCAVVLGVPGREPALGVPGLGDAALAFIFITGESISESFSVLFTAF